jgi:hypothetical protein
VGVGIICMTLHSVYLTRFRTYIITKSITRQKPRMGGSLKQIYSCLDVLLPSIALSVEEAGIFPLCFFSIVQSSIN